MKAAAPINTGQALAAYYVAPLGLKFAVVNTAKSTSSAKPTTDTFSNHGKYKLSPSQQTRLAKMC